MCQLNLWNFLSIWMGQMPYLRLISARKRMVSAQCMDMLPNEGPKKKPVMWLANKIQYGTLIYYDIRHATGHFSKIYWFLDQQTSNSLMSCRTFRIIYYSDQQMHNKVLQHVSMYLNHLQGVSSYICKSYRVKKIRLKWLHRWLL